MQERVRIATDWMQLMWLKAQLPTFSPLTHNDHIGVLIHEGRTRTVAHDAILNFDMTVLAVCKRIHVLQLPGFEESEGIKRELKFAYKRNISVEPITPDILVHYKIVQSLDYLPYPKFRRLDDVAREDADSTDGHGH